MILRPGVSSLARLAVRRPRTVLAVAVTLSLACGSLLIRAEPSGDMVELFMDEDRAADTYRRLCEELGGRELMVAAWPVADPEELFAPELLAAQGAAAEEMASWPEVSTVLPSGARSAWSAAGRWGCARSPGPRRWRRPTRRAVAR
ncbi:MAG TPA: hypothetical protein VMT85_18715 [Thermoanaerobaculia bacterium]|nr:hypothetical protein [Thermoanaerobaculia bacterium]